VKKYIAFHKEHGEYFPVPPEEAVMKETWNRLTEPE